MNQIGPNCSAHACDECVRHTFCHFCEKDYQCHPLYSGCTFGMQQCHKIEDCQRTAPERIGYGPPVSVVLGVFCLVLTLLCCCGACSMISHAFRKYRKRNRSPVPLKDQSTEESEEPLLERDQFAFEEHTYEEIETPVSRPRYFIKRGLLLVSVVGFTIVALMYYPRIPDYNVCNRKFDWESIFSSFKSLTPKVEYKILLSVSNENRFRFELSDSIAMIYHKKVLVGNWTMKKGESWIAEAGAITDIFITIHIEPGFREGLKLWNDFRNNSLVFTIDSKVSGNVKWGNVNLYHFSAAVNGIEFLVGADYPRDLCKCTEYYKPKNHSTIPVIEYADTETS